ncbi:MAG: hypothetical protein JXQ97_04855 [Natronospirillum sp.]
MVINFSSNRALSVLEQSEKQMVIWIYALYLSIFVTTILLPAVGLALALWQRKKLTTELGLTHVNRQIRLATRCFSVFLAALILFIATLLAMSEFDQDWLILVLAVSSIALFGSLVWFTIGSITGLVSLLLG